MKTSWHHGRLGFIIDIFLTLQITFWNIKTSTENRFMQNKSSHNLVYCKYCVQPRCRDRRKDICYSLPPKSSCHKWHSREHLRHGPLTRNAKLRIAHMPGMLGTFSPPPRVSDLYMHHGTCVTHVPWCMPGSLTSGFLWSRWRGKCSRHSWRMRIPQHYVSGKMSMWEWNRIDLREWIWLLKQSTPFPICMSRLANIKCHFNCRST